MMMLLLLLPQSHMIYVSGEAKKWPTVTDFVWFHLLRMHINLVISQWESAHTVEYNSLLCVVFLPHLLVLFCIRHSVMGSKPLAFYCQCLRHKQTEITKKCPNIKHRIDSKSAVESLLRNHKKQIGYIAKFRPKGLLLLLLLTWWWSWW